MFDLDGTLIDSAGDIRAALNATLAGEGQAPFDLGAVRGFIGDGVPKLVERAMTARDIDRRRHNDLVATFMRHYGADPAARTTIYRGAAEALDVLSGAGFRLGLCTNKPGALARDILRRLDLIRRFDAVVGGDETAARKPDPQPLLETARRLGAGEVVYVGDSIVDSETADRAGIPFLLFTGGYRDRPADEVAASARFDHYDELASLIDVVAAQTSRSGTSR